jgi:S-formylglutathione hydrolase FrmB
MSALKLKFTFVVFLTIFSRNYVFAQLISNKGFVQESLYIKSAVLGRDIKYSVYLPYDYYSSNRLYPVLYLLHGYTDNEITWIQNGEVQITADKLITNKESVPLIIIMPDGGLTWYINNYNDSIRYEDAFFLDFMPTIEKTYRIRFDKKFRAIGGLSMGGYGALLYSFKHPDVFSGCIAFSAAIRNDSLMIKRLKIGESNSVICYGKLKGDTLPENWKRNSLLNLAISTPFEKLCSVKYYIDCGDKDALIYGNSLLNFILNDRQVPHEFRVRKGKHEWIYWRNGLKDGLEFINLIFNR